MYLKRNNFLSLAAAAGILLPAGGGRAATGGLGAGETYRERVPLAAGEYFHATVRQIGIDVALVLKSPGGETLAEIDTPTGDRGIEEISWVAAVDGEHVLEIQSTDPDAGGGQYDLALEARRPAKPEDELRVRAEALSSRGHALGAAGDAESARKGLADLTSALPLWRQIADRRGEALTLYGMGRITQLLRETDAAIRHYTAALALWQAIGDRNEEGSTLFSLATAERVVGDTPAALRHYDEAFQIARDLANPAMEAEVLTSLGELRNALGDKPEALELYQRALLLIRASRQRVGELRTLNSLGYLYEFRGERQRALDAYREALQLTRETRQRAGEAMVLGNLGRLYGNLGEYEQADAYLRQALEIRRQLGDRGLEATVLLYLGQLSAARGDYATALESYAKALPLLAPVENRRKEAAALNSLGEAHLAMGDVPAARARFDESLALARAAGDRYLEGAVRTNRGAALGAAGQTDAAILEIEAALPIRRSIGDREGEAAATYQLARLMRTRGNLAAARRHAEESLRLVEGVRVDVSSQALRASYLSTARQPYELAVELLMESHRGEPDAGFDARALETSERARARSLLELLGESRLDFRAEADPGLLERERALRERLRGKVERQIRLASENALAEVADRVAAEVRDLTAEHEQVLAQIRARNPHYAALTQPRTLRLAEIQREVLDQDTLLLEYALGEERSYVFAVTPESRNVYELPGRSEVESAARAFYEVVSAGRGAAAGAGSAGTERLSSMLLGPPSKELPGKRILIVADGALQYVPFAALGDPTSPGKSLVDGHEIVVLPSASVLAVLRREAAGRRPAPRLLAVLADPVFDSEDQRVQRAAGSSPRPDAPRGEASPQGSGATSRAAEGLPAGLPRLAFTRREARAILDLVPDHQRFEALDFAADRETATSPRLGDFRFVHFATHGLINTRQPELSGIVLSLVDPSGHPRDGFLTATDIFGLRLPADVVVLSACRTALGREVRGEGLVGITRGFLYAGARGVVASLWTVDDVATAELMKRFYAGMLGKERLAPAAALRAAQASMAKTRRWSAPYYWAGFLLQGDWN